MTRPDTLAGSPRRVTLGPCVALGAAIVAASDAAATPWGHHVDWTSPGWWAWQASVAAVVGMALGAIARDGDPVTRRLSRPPATPGKAWRLHRLARRLTHEVVADGGRPDRAGPDPADGADSRRAAFAAQLASPVASPDPMDGDGPEGLRLALAILVLQAAEPDLAASTALATQSGGVARGLGNARKGLDADPDTRAAFRVMAAAWVARNAFWETAVLQAARDLGGEFDPMHVAHLAGTHRAVWLALTGRPREPFPACAGIEAHAREEGALGRPLAEPEVEDAVLGPPARR